MKWEKVFFKEMKKKDKIAINFVFISRRTWIEFEMVEFIVAKVVCGIVLCFFFFLCLKED